MSITAKRIEKTIESVCRRGCNYVRQVISDLDHRQARDIPEMRELRLAQERTAVLSELKEIMAVYDDSGNGCCPLPEVGDTPVALKKANQ